MTRLGRWLAGRGQGAEMPAKSPVPLPLHGDWAWRPALWQAALEEAIAVPLTSPTRLGGDVKLYHDDPEAALSVRQWPNAVGQSPAAFKVEIGITRFSGSFLSLVLDLPEAATLGLSRRHVIGLSVDLELSEPLDVYARLNIRHGPNTETIARLVPATTRPAHVDFDLGPSAINDRRVTSAWLDLILERPGPNLAALRDLTMSRRPRAGL